MRLTHIAAVFFVLAIPVGGHAYTVKQTSAGATLHWRAEVVELAIHESMVARFGEEGARSALADAIAAWSGAERGPALVIGRITDAPPGFQRGSPSNGVYSVSPWPYEKKLLAVTVSSYDTRTGELLDADILLNGDEAIVSGVRDDHYDLASVLAHELGHVLGLGESEEEPASTMYPRIGKSDARARTPSADDFEGLHAIYDMDRHDSRAASLMAPRFRGFWAMASFFAGVLVLLLGVKRSHGEASEMVLPMRWSAQERWDEEHLHS